MDIKDRFEAALCAFVDKIKNDSNIRAVILYGSLVNDTVWEKSDIDVYVLVRENKRGKVSYCIEEDGIIINIALQTEFDFKRGLERSPGDNWTFSMFSGARVVYTKDESLHGFVEEFSNMGADDRDLSFFHNSTWLLGGMEKIEKWLTVKGDPLYAQMWVLKEVETYAHMRLILDKKPPSREAVLKVMTYAPEAIKHLYERPMQGFMSRDEVADVLKFFRNFLTENLDMLKRPAKRYMSDGAARTLTTLCNHFGMCSHEIYHIFDFLEESGVVARVTEPVRLSKNSKSTVEEVAFIYLGSCPDSSLTEVSCEENNRSNRRKSE